MEEIELKEFPKINEITPPVLKKQLDEKKKPEESPLPPLEVDGKETKFHSMRIKEASSNTIAIEIAGSMDNPVPEVFMVPKSDIRNLLASVF